MARLFLEKMVLGRWALVVGCAPLVMLAGCPQDRSSAPGKAPVQATAPTLAAGPSGSPRQAMQPAEAAAQTADAAAKAAKVQQLINKAEAAYRSGVDNYRAGHLDAARLDFDSAVDLMLTSGMDVKSDPQLADEFDHLLNAVNSLEMAALKQGNGFSPVLEAAPLDAANEVTFPANAALTAKVTAELKTTQSDFPLVVNDYVAGFISYFSNSANGHAHLLRSLERAGKYREMISKNLRDQGVPQDLIYLAVAESGFQPQALNARSGAGGMWQFMPTGAYGLARNGWFDERFDPEKSSLAYAKYMKTLYNQFGDWYLAMAAYDWGPGNVQRAVMRTGYADFWELYRRNVLPAETKNYVPGIIAAIIMSKNPEQYGLDKVVTEKPVASDAVKIDYPVDLRLVAECVDASTSTLQDLNPSLLRLTTPKDREFELRLPAGTKDRYLSSITAIPPDMRVWWRYHKVAPGDTLTSVARAFHTSRQAIVQANNLDGDENLRVESELIIPVAPGKHPAEEIASYSRHATTYKVRKADTVQTVADNFGVPPAMVRRWNHLKGDSVRGRRVLYIHQPVAPDSDESRQVVVSRPKPKQKLQTSSTKTVVHHKVQRGETLSSIAKSHNTTVDALKENNGNLANLRPGMILVIGSPSR